LRNFKIARISPGERDELLLRKRTLALEEHLLVESKPSVVNYYSGWIAVDGWRKSESGGVMTDRVTALGAIFVIVIGRDL